ncbi:MAG TPA: ATP-binding cassette domain-containing protein [candidate division Zixibacteria bacterium]|nr:ATP-binding cassette domain-containing protein [candidate division Zixibacteria bacterium]
MAASRRPVSGSPTSCCGQDLAFLPAGAEASPDNWIMVSPSDILVVVPPPLPTRPDWTAGAVFGFIGPNGAGKTTTLRLLLALQRPTRGEARLWGQVVRPGAKVLRDVGALVERPGFYPYLSGRRNLLLFAAARGLRGPEASDAVQVALESVDMTGPASRPVGGYSTGMQQRLAIGLASLGDPRLVILDEPTAGLDPDGVIAVRALVGRLAAHGTTVFLSTHLLNEAEQLCSHIGLLSRGQLIAYGQRDELLVGQEVRVVRFDSPDDLHRALQVLQDSGVTAEALDERACKVSTSESGRALSERLAAAGAYPSEIAPQRRTLEDLYREISRHASEVANASGRVA